VKLTKAQLNDLLNQHIGTGYIIVNTDTKNIRIASLNLGRNGEWYAGDNFRPLANYMVDLSREIQS